MRLACIVEGHGEVAAVPILVDRILQARAPGLSVQVSRPVHRVPRGKMLKTGELERAVELQARKAGPGGAVLVMVDAEDDCAARLGPELLSRVRRDDVRVGVVVAVRMYEAWLAASSGAFAGVRGFDAGVSPPPDPEGITSPKKWLEQQMGGKYSETVDQPALTSRMDVDAASTSASFRKLLRELSRILDVDLTMVAGELDP